MHSDAIFNKKFIFINSLNLCLIFIRSHLFDVYNEIGKKTYTQPCHLKLYLIINIINYKSLTNTMKKIT